MTRSAADVGAGLEPPRPPRPIRPGERIHVVGAAGAGASAAALHAHWAGAVVSGCDPGGASPYSVALKSAGIELAWRHDPAHIAADRPERLAVTKALTAIAPDEPELVAARSAGIPVQAWQQVVADAAVGRTLVAVAGTHGKSTSAGWLTHLLVDAGRDPAAFVGALLPVALTGGAPATARQGRGGAFVVEADEYAGNFDAFLPEIAIVTSVDWDHPDVFADLDGVVEAVARWLERAAAAATQPPTLVANVADAGVERLIDRLAAWPGRLIATALVDVAPQRLGGYGRGIAERFHTAGGATRTLIGRPHRLDPDGSTLEIRGLGDSEEPHEARVQTAGRHNAANALGVAGAALALGLEADEIVRGLATFAGVGRRLERLGERGGVVVYDDYGHHPTAIHETIRATRQREPGRRLWAVLEPLTYHRTAALKNELGAALATADAVVVADIWPGRDPDRTIASPQDVAGAAARVNAGIPIATPGSVEATASWLAGEVHPNDVVLVMGGGRSYKIAELLLHALDTR
ncbi:MAG TPA: cyanophycin synthetase [Candidatus Polarisedimenticolia bacterium]|nr:cyanophycin synthetase [Candidatus Polarisedimenticolia bacterium]